MKIIFPSGKEFLLADILSYISDNWGGVINSKFFRCVVPIFFGWLAIFTSPHLVGSNFGEPIFVIWFTSAAFIFWLWGIDSSRLKAGYEGNDIKEYRLGLLVNFGIVTALVTCFGLWLSFNLAFSLFALGMVSLGYSVALWLRGIDYSDAEDAVWSGIVVLLAAPWVGLLIGKFLTWLFAFAFIDGVSLLAIGLLMMLAVVLGVVWAYQSNNSE